MTGARSLLALAVAALPLFGAGTGTFQVQGVEASPWAKVFGAVGMTEVHGGHPTVIVLGPNEHVNATALAATHLVIVEGAGAIAESLGIHAGPTSTSVRQICDSHAPQMQIIWEQPLAVPGVEVPGDFQLFATERWKAVPVLAGKRVGRGAVLWIAAAPGPSGNERFPYLLQAAVDLGLELPVGSANLWAFFDSAYRIHADVDYLAQRWRKAGISVLHVAGWHNMEPDATQDDYLRNLIVACHRNAILVYVWLELPHVSEKFWAAHPDWREKTAVGQDAQLDWRKLMNLQNPACRREVESEVSGLLQRFDWDGVNVAELYFESLEGAANPARLTPMNADVRAEFKAREGFDPQSLFNGSQAFTAETRAAALRKFLNYRAALATRMQKDWLDALTRCKSSKPYLDVVLTHIDDRFEPGIRDALGADVASSLPAIKQTRSTLLVEDPATLWSLGPERYAKLAAEYSELTPEQNQLAVDINVVERYQDVYPTKKQTGTELLQLVHQASSSFFRVALYFENSIEKQDLALLPAAATSATAKQVSVDEMDVTATETTRVNWQGPVEVDGKLWPLQSTAAVLAPSGRHRLRPAVESPGVLVCDFNGDVQSAVANRDRADISYTSKSRAIAAFATPVNTVEVDGMPFWKSDNTSKTGTILLPAGQHVVTFLRDSVSLRNP